MVRRKNVRTRGKLQFSKYFQNLVIGDAVAIIREKSKQASFPERLQGRTGIVESKRGKSYVIKVRDQSKEKKFIVEPIHLKKIKQE